MKYYLYETNVCASIESWIPDLSLKEARNLGKKSNHEIVKIFTDDANVKLVEVIKEYNFKENTKNDPFRKIP